MFILVRSQYLEDYGTRHKFKGGHEFAIECDDLGDAIAQVHNYLFKKNLEWHTLGISEGKKHAPTVEFPIVPNMVLRDEYEFNTLESLVAHCDEWVAVYVLREGKLAETIPSRIKHSWELPSAHDTPTEHDSPARLEQVNELPDQEY